MTSPWDLTEPQRRQLREAPAAAKAARPPSKPWRVYGARGISTDFRGQRAAYDAVNTITKAGNKATVYHWEDGRWVKYEVIDPGEWQS